MVFITTACRIITIPPPPLPAPVRARRTHAGHPRCSGGYTVFTDEAEFYSTLQAFLNSTAGAKFSSSVAVTADADGTLSGVRATAIQADYSGSINGEAMKQVQTVHYILLSLVLDMILSVTGAWNHFFPRPRYHHFHETVLFADRGVDVPSGRHSVSVVMQAE